MGFLKVHSMKGSASLPRMASVLRPHARGMNMDDACRIHIAPCAAPATRPLALGLASPGTCSVPRRAS